MTAATAMVAIPTGLAATVAVAGALLWWRSYRRDPGTPQTREWTVEELRHLRRGWVPPSRDGLASTLRYGPGRAVRS